MASDEPTMGKTKSFTDRELKKRGSELKHATTKEYSDEPTEAEVQAVKKIYDEKSANLKELARHFLISSELLADTPPADAAAFTKGLFQGLYTADRSEAAKDKLRKRLQGEIKRTSSKLRESFTKESASDPAAEDLALAIKVYEGCAGDLGKIARAMNLQEKLIREDFPVNASEFAAKLYAGSYTPDIGQAAKKQLRETLKPQITRAVAHLKKSKTRESAELGAEDPDLVLAKKLYPGRNAKEIEAVAAKLGLSAQNIRTDPGETADDFAKKLLGGAYTADDTEVVKAALRVRLESAIRERRPSLSHVTTRRMSNVSDEEITNFGAFYTKKGGNLQAIATESGIPVEALKASPPANSADFALKLMSGVYMVDMNEQAKATLRACMRQEMVRTAKLLKKSETKEWDGTTDEEDIKLIAASYTQKAGDLALLASYFGLSLAALEAKKPSDAQDFAKSVLLGSYTAA